MRPESAIQTGFAQVRRSQDDGQEAASPAGMALLSTGPDLAPAFFQAELAKHQKLVKQSGATLD